MVTYVYISKCNINNSKHRFNNRPVGPICHFKHIMHEKRKENNTDSSGLKINMYKYKASFSTLEFAQFI